MRLPSRVGRRRGRNRAPPRLASRVRDEEQDKSRDKAPSSVQTLLPGLAKVTLHPQPRAVEAAAPSLRSWIMVPLDNHNTLPAIINGQHCVLYVDCGTTSAMIAHHLASKLGLLEKVSFVKSYELQLWTTKERHSLQVVENVQVELAGGVELCCTFLVLPENMKSTLPDILLDNSTLRQAGAIQEFTASACTLYFPRSRPRKTAVKGGDSQYVLDVTLRRRFISAKKLNVHVDTGATSFYMSPRCVETLLCLPPVPCCVSLVLTKDVVVTSDLVRKAGTDTFDFVVGKEMLSRYRSILDFASYSLYFRVGERAFRLKLRRSRTV